MATKPDEKVIKGLQLVRNAHYVLHEGKDSDDGHRAAIVVQILNRATGFVNLVVFLHDTDFTTNILGISRKNALYSEKKEPGTWHYPEYVP